MSLLHPSSHATAATAARPRAVGGRTLLLVDDDEINRMVTEAFLHSLGHADVQLASGGREALALCEAHDYALVLMDCVMPDLDGLETTRRLRARGLRMPIVALTASCEPCDIARCVQAGMDDHLAKPLELQRLVATLAHWLPARAGAPSLN